MGYGRYYVNIPPSSDMNGNGIGFIVSNLAPVKEEYDADGNDVAYTEIYASVASNPMFTITNVSATEISSGTQTVPVTTFTYDANTGTGSTTDTLVSGPFYHNGVIMIDVRALEDYSYVDTTASDGIDVTVVPSFDELAVVLTTEISFSKT